MRTAVLEHFPARSAEGIEYILVRVPDDHQWAAESPPDVYSKQVAEILALPIVLVQRRAIGDWRVFASEDPLSQHAESLGLDTIRWGSWTFQPPV